MPQQSQVRVDAITNLAGDGPVEFTYGISVPSGSSISGGGNLNVTGVTTTGSLQATQIIASGIVTAGSFIGNGSALTSLPTTTVGQTIGFAILA